ncbi:hypothetical protein ACFX2I_040731 [Malus domestica]
MEELKRANFPIPSFLKNEITKLEGFAYTGTITGLEEDSEATLSANSNAALEAPLTSSTSEKGKTAIIAANSDDENLR